MVTEHRVVASQRAREAIPSPIRKLTPLADRARASGVHIYHVNIGQPDLPTPAAIMEGIRRYEGQLLPYAPSQGVAETVDAWRAYYEQVGLHFERDEILVTSGGSEAVMFALMAVADPGDEIIVFEPTYANYFGFAVMASLNVVPVTTHPEDGYHLPDAATIEAAITSRTRALCFCTIGNPTGTVYSERELRMLGDIAAKHDLFLISDETYREIVFDGPRDTSMMKIRETAEQTILVDSVSKRFSATGARVGCIASKHAGVMQGALCFAQARLAGATAEQRAVIPLLRDSRAYTDWLVDVYRRRRDVVFSAMQDIPGALVRRPEGAFYILAVLPIDDGERFASWLLTDFRLNGETVMVSPGEGFYVTPGLGKREVRLAFVLEEKALERSIQILCEALRVYPGREG